MSLRLQLLAFVALTLFLPWAGLRLIPAMEEALRLSLEQQLRRGATDLAQDVAASSAFSSAAFAAGARSPDAAPPLYLHPLLRQPRPDGQRDDWQFARASSDEPADARALELADGIRIWLGTPDPSLLYLYIEVDDDSVVAQTVPGRAPHGDRVVLAFGPDPANPETVLLATSGGAEVRRGESFPIRGQRSPGAETYVSGGEFVELIRGAFRYRRSGAAIIGYAIEAYVPMVLIDGPLNAEGSFGLGVIDSDQGDASARLVAATWREDGGMNPLIHELPALLNVLRPYQSRLDRYRIIDSGGWVIADTGPLELAPIVEPDAQPSLLERFFRRILRRDDPEYAAALLGTPGRVTDPALLRALDGETGSAWYRRGTDVSAIVATSVPIDPDNPGRGAVLIEQGSDPILSLANRPMLNLITTTVLVSVFAAVASLAYASLLSFRIRRLARAAESALGPRGEISIRLPGASARDEIGALSRSFQDLLGRLRDYTDYLQSLKSKLSHELRTPLAIVATSVDNLEHEAQSEAARAYLGRLRQGATRLESILQAMTAATRVEQAIHQADIETFDFAAVVATCVASYRDVYPSHSFAQRLPAEPVTISGSAELVAQLLDKLIDNAVSFAAEGTPIEVTLAVESRHVRLEVINRGPLLPAAMRHQLFDSLVSVRDDRGDKPHLGLGLYIVMLIAEFHRGSVAADNLADGSGVVFVVDLPRGAGR